jgi:rod shape-determining protein MreC
VAETLFNRGLSPLARFILCVILAVALFVVDLKMTVLNRVREQISVVLYPVQRVATAPLEFIAFSSEFLTSQNRLLEENKRLTSENLSLRENLMPMNQLRVENKILRNMQALANRQPNRSVLAEVSYRGYNPFLDRLMINRGSHDGIEPGQVVLDAYGLLGQVVRTQAFSSEIRIVTDKDYPVPVMVVRNELRAVIYGGTLPNTMEVRFLPFNSDIKVGDTLVTAGTDGVYSPGIPVAVVQSIESNPGSMFAKIICKPLAKAQEERFVLVVTNQQKAAQATPEASAVEGR